MILLLASKSETRRRMLEAAAVEFEIADPDLDEETAKQGLLEAGFEPRDLAEGEERRGGCRRARPWRRPDAGDV